MTCPKCNGTAEDWTNVSTMTQALAEAVVALQWIAGNTTDLPADFQNQGVRLRQVADRANEALRDVNCLLAEPAEGQGPS